MQTDLLGERVRFRISDVRMPEPSEVLARLHGDDLLEGRVADFTDSGAEPEAYALVEVADFDGPLVVPTRALNPSHI